MADNTSTAADVEPFILALDIGTSSARALVYDGRGIAVPGLEAHEPYEVRTTADGGAESVADDLVGVVAAAVDVVHALIVKQGSQIRAVACDTYWHSLLGVDASGEATTPVFTWADTRSAPDAQALRAQLDDQATHARTGARIHSSYWPAKLRWLKRTNPDAFARTRHWISFGDYLYLHLFGDLAVSVSMASGTGVFDQRACTWDVELLRAVGVDATALSPIHDSQQTFEGLRGDRSRRWPLLAKIPWYLPSGTAAAITWEAEERMITAPSSWWERPAPCGFCGEQTPSQFRRDCGRIVWIARESFRAEPCPRAATCLHG
jgi:gluconokinase